MKDLLTFHRRQLLWMGSAWCILLLAYGLFLISSPQAMLLIPFVLGFSPLFLWGLSLVDLRLRLQLHELPPQENNAQNAIFDDPYEVLLLKRQFALVQNKLLPLGAFVVVLLFLGVAFVQITNPWQWSDLPPQSKLASTAFILLMGAIWFVSGRYGTGISKNEPQATTTCTLGGLAIYISMSLLFFGSQVFCSNSAVDFLAPWLKALSVAPLIVYPIEWIMRLIWKHYGSEALKHPVYCPHLPLIAWQRQIKDESGEHLQYQFGVDLKTGIGSLLRQYGPAGALVFCLALALGDIVLIVPQGHRALVTTLGRLDPTPLPPGLHFKAPHPLASHHLIDTGGVQRLVLGAQHKSTDDALWSSAGHDNDLLLIVQSPPELREQWPIEVIAASAEVTYRWEASGSSLFEHRYPENVLQREARQALTRLQLTTSTDQLMRASRSTIEDQLKITLQERCRQLHLGVSILTFAVPQLHPPSQVVKSFEETVAARFQKDIDILRAETVDGALQARLNNTSATRLIQAQAQGNILLARGQGDWANVTQLSRTVAIHPELYWKRRQLKLLPKATEGMRRILLLRDGGVQVQNLDLKSTLEPELFDIQLQSRHSKP